MAPGIFDRAQVHDAAAGSRDLLHLVPVQAAQQPGVGHARRIGGHHAVHILQDLAAHRAQGRRQGDGGGVRAAAAEGGDLFRQTDALEAGHHHGEAAREGFTHPVAAHFEDAGIAVAGVGDDAALAAGQADGGTAFAGQRHRQQTGGDALAHRQQHVQFAARRFAADLARQFVQVVGRVAHGADHDDQPVAAVARTAEVGGDRFQALDRGEAGASVFPHQDAGVPGCFRGRGRVGHAEPLVVHSELCRTGLFNGWAGAMDAGAARGQL